MELRLPVSSLQSLSPCISKLLKAEAPWLCHAMPLDAGRDGRHPACSVAGGGRARLVKLCPPSRLRRVGSAAPLSSPSGRRHASGGGMPYIHTACLLLTACAVKLSRGTANGAARPSDPQALQPRVSTGRPIAPAAGGWSSPPVAACSLLEIRSVSYPSPPHPSPTSCCLPAVPIPSGGTPKPSRHLTSVPPHTLCPVCTRLPPAHAPPISTRLALKILMPAPHRHTRSVISGAPRR